MHEIKITTYAEMNERIVGLLRLNGENAVMLYAAQRIENMEAALRAIRDSPETDLGLYARLCMDLAERELGESSIGGGGTGGAEG